MTHQETWQLAGEAPAVYERDLLPRMLGPLARALVEKTDLKPGDRVLDVACGTGAVGRHVLPALGPGGSVAGVDLNLGMLRTGRSALAAGGTSPHWLQADAQALPFAAGTFDWALSSQGLQYFSDKPAALGEMRRVLKPGGGVGIGVARPLEFNPVHARVTERLARHIDREAGRILAGGFAFEREHDLGALLEEAGFRPPAVHEVEVPVRFPSAGEFIVQMVAGSPLAGPVARARPEDRRAFFEGVKADLRPFEDGGDLRFHIRTRVAVARR